MNIPPETLAHQFERAIKAWPFLLDVERQYGLPSFLLFAVGSRETNLTDETGDGGHGHGVFQLDDRYHLIPSPFPVDEQADLAGRQLHALSVVFGGDWLAAVCAYNAGAGGVERALQRHLSPDTVTTGHDYGTDVLGRRAFLALHVILNPPEIPDVPKPTDKVRFRRNPNGPGRYVLQADGGLLTLEGAPWPPPPYEALANTGQTYAFPADNSTVWSYPGLDATERQGDRYFVDFDWNVVDPADRP